jgi:hypothetical protein
MIRHEKKNTIKEGEQLMEIKKEGKENERTQISK